MAEKGLGNAWGLAVVPTKHTIELGIWKADELVTTTMDVVDSLNKEFANLGIEKNYVVDGINEARDLKGTDVSTIAWRYYWDAILGNVDIEETWEDYLADLDAAGLQEIIDGDQAILVQ